MTIAGKAPLPASDPQPSVTLSPGSNLPIAEILQPGDLEKHAASLKDDELLAHLKTAFSEVRKNLQHNLPYLLDARRRFAKPGQRLPVEGKPTWTQWVRANLRVDIRTVQRWLAAPKTKDLPPKKEKQLRPVTPLEDWPDAMRAANDLVTAVTRLKGKSAVGADMLIHPLRELESLVAAGSKAAGMSIEATVGPDLNVAAARVRELAREFSAIQAQFDGEEQEYLNFMMVNIATGEPEPPFPSKN